MSNETMSMDELLKTDETEFDSHIKTMHAKALMDLISRLQKEMTKEQENFNSLNTELQNRKARSSRQSKQISKDMMLSQQRLTTLMNRSMKCFAQQNVNPSNQGTQLSRRNSAKGLQPVVSPNQRSTNVHRSRSLHAVNKLNEMSSVTHVVNEPSRSNNVVSIGSQRHHHHHHQQQQQQQHQPVIKSVANGKVHNNIANIGGRTVIVKASSQGSLASGEKQAPEMSVSKKSIVGGSGDGGGSVPNNPATASTRDGKFLSSTIPHSSSSTAAATTTTTTAADDVGGGGSGGGGMYTKRKQGQSNRVTTSSTVTFLPPRGPMSSSHTSLSSPSGSNVVVLKTPQPRPASIAYSHSPLQQALSRPGVSQSQIIGQGTATSEISEDGRALPSVKMLAKSFGSSSALHHVTPASSTNSGSVSGKRTNIVVVSGNHGSRSVSSNVYSNDSKKSGSQSNPVSFTKGKTSSGQSSVTVNGKAVTSPQKPADGASELEMARARLKTNRNSVEIITDSPVSGPSNGVSNNENRLLDSTDSAAADEAKQKEQRIAENVRVGTYVKRTVPQAPPSGSNSSSNSQPTSSAKPTIVTISSAKSNPVPSQQLSGNFSNTENKTLNGPHISSAAMPEVKVAKMKYNKSKEELQSDAKIQKPVPDRTSLLKQIESRRVDFDNDQSNPVFKSTAKLSASMPSLLTAGK